MKIENMEKDRKNSFCVISKESLENGLHDIQTNNAWEENPYGNEYAVVPDKMVESIMATCGFCDIELNEDGTEVVSFIAREIPAIEVPEAEPTTDEILDTLLGVDDE